MPQAMLRNAWLNVQEHSLRAAGRLALATGLSKPIAAHLTTGDRGETAALFFLRREGYIVTARQWKTPKYRGDIDLIAWEGDALCFVEVKTRTNRDVRYPAESAVTMHKRNQIRKLAREYRRHVTAKRPARVRFDVVEVYGNPWEKPEFLLWRGLFSRQREI